MTALLEVNDLVVRYPSGSLMDRLRGEPRDVTVLDGVSLTLGPGETLGLVGESGSGKTTLGRAIGGLTPMASGSITLAGASATGEKDGFWREMRRNVGFMFQDPMAALDPRMRLAASITEPLAVNGAGRAERRRRAGELLAEVGLSPDFAGRFPHQISGGQARRVTVARALALRPKLVIADEPTAGLDLSVQGELLNLLNAIQAASAVSFLFITHNLAVARHVTDRIAVMYLGRIVESARTAEIFARPAHPYTRALLSAHGRPGAPPPLKGEVPSLKRRPRGCAFHTRCPLAAELCRREAPAERILGPLHQVRCHFPLATAGDAAPHAFPAPPEPARSTP
ncbi:peptide/nickel transport system ATP-binding protein [Ancylobacter sp. 3268]|uniref:ABC transporter ATP-binding protein n=1 Tax=Ancylobacter sp. 3268 TaxID=2817752 RepID=UPI00285873D1|nr:ABC transporter ATP-binding protein [Ancylobacter sp. 3268]MDR6953218.1 peptide/nickel transport system ATP-binding protein [Ancylobacter sp. 3268]